MEAFSESDWVIQILLATDWSQRMLCTRQLVISTPVRVLFIKTAP